MHWQQRERDHISALCKARGIETEVLGIVRDDYSIPEYKAAMREVEAAVAEIEILSQEKEEIVSVLEESEIMYDKTTKAISEQETVLEDINDQIREAEQKRTQRLNEMSNIINAGKYAANEAQEITESAKEVKPVFGGEPMVKISRKKFDKIVEKYKMARTFERLYKDYYGKCSAQELTIQSLRQTIADLTSKVRQFTNFIESKGLVAAFKEFLQPKPKSVIKTLRDNQEKVKTKDEQVRKLKPEIKKK
jgi:chromosome segregation ATPase